MLPILLQLQGVYSYVEEQTIDFKSLTAAGLFGIFGQVGAGKSSIIESIVVALYGKNERLDSAGFWYNMLNLKCNKAFIKLEFEFEKELYRFEVHWKRNGKKYEDVKGERTAYKWLDGMWMPIEPNAKDILGLSYEHFKRTTIIPQGKFKEFLELKASERTSMIKEIFELYRFDLKDKISAKHKEVEASKHQLDGVLLTFANIDMEGLVPLELKIQQTQFQLTEQQEKLNTVQSEWQAYKGLQDLWQTKNNLIADLTLLAKEEEYYKVRQQKINEYTIIYQTFDGSIQLRKQLKSRLTELEQSNKLATAKLKESHATILSLKKEFEPLKVSYEQLEEKRQRIKEFDTVKTIIETKKAILHLKQRKKAGDDHIAHKVEERERLTATINQYKTKLNNLGKSVLDLALIQAIDEWMWQEKKLHDDQLACQLKVKEWQQKHQGILNKCTEHSINVNDTQKLLAAQEHNASVLVDNQNAQQQLLVQLELNNYAANLKDGIPCPLCGAVEHNDIRIHTNLNEELLQLQSVRAMLELEQKKIANQLAILEKAKIELAHIQQEQDLQAANLASINQQIELHHIAFNFPNYSLDNLEVYEEDKKRFIKQENEYKEINQAIRIEQDALDKTYAALQKYEDGIREFNVQIERNEAALKVHYESIKSIDGNYYAQQELTVIDAQKQTLVHSINHIEQAYQLLNQQIIQEERAYSQTQGVIENIQNQQEELIQQFTLIEEKTKRLLAEYNKKDITEVEDILEEKIDISQEHKIIQSYFQKLLAAKQQLEALEITLAGKSFDKGILEELTSQVALLTQLKEETFTSLAQHKAQHTQLQQQIDAYKIHKKEHELIATKLDHLTELKKLFIGDKFIEFISGTYLEQLCHHANHRFHRLTKNNLSLSINEKMEFEIIDYLNGGKSRSVKTLSGGQSFQASLCLALALAESVQAKSKQEQNFFFIDEGFGTQDKESIPTIFETLLAISNENRIVGVISHVEELQENINRYLYVSHGTQGSSIQQY